MEAPLHIQKTFDKVILIDQKINQKEFEDCVFSQCDFSNAVFSNCTFIDCEFQDCNLSLLALPNSALKNVHFKNCKLLGIAFHNCTDFLFEVQFSDCILDYASFARKKMPKTLFSNTSLKEVSFVNCNLTQAKFDNCNLERAIFNETQLKEVNFSSAYNYTIDPDFNPMKKAIFSLQGIPGLLEKYDIKIS